MVASSPDPAKPHLRRNSSIIKFLCSYGGKIVPRYPDGKLRYHGGETRVLAVDRSISFSELLLKLRELCGMRTVSLRCQLPNEDLDALVSITSDEDLANLIEEYDRASTLKIRAFLSLPKKISPTTPPLPPPPSSASTSKSSTSSSSSSSSSSSNSYRATIGSTSPPRCYHHQISKPVAYSVKKTPHYGYHVHGSPTHVYLVHNRITGNN